MKSPDMDEKVYEYDEKVFFFQKMDESRNAMLHQILSDRHPGTISKSKKKGLVLDGDLKWS